MSAQGIKITDHYEARTLASAVIKQAYYDARALTAAKVREALAPDPVGLSGHEMASLRSRQLEARRGLDGLFWLFDNRRTTWRSDRILLVDCLRCLDSSVDIARIRAKVIKILAPRGLRVEEADGQVQLIYS